MRLHPHSWRRLRPTACLTVPVAACLTALLAVPGSPALAASPIAEILCDSTPRLQTRLKTVMQSERDGMGLRGPEQVMQVWTDKRGDWTMVVAYATWTSCIVAMGENWEGNQAEDPA